MKKIIFFDADGTIWYPKSTKHNKHPVWVWREYGHDLTLVRKEIVLLPGALKTLKRLNKEGIKLVILSTSPYPKKQAAIRIRANARHFKIENLFAEIHGTREYFSSKGEYIKEILKKQKIAKKHALMVGDMYEWDYKPAKDAGIDAILIKHNYEKFHPSTRKVKNRISKFSEILRYV